MTGGTSRVERVAVGGEVLVDFTKFDGAQHWQVPTRLLGVDEHGTWLHSPAGTRHRRPGAQLVLEHASVVCVPKERWWVASFYAQPVTPDALSLYVDVTTPPRWDAGVVTMVDLDLDVVVCADRAPFVDDEEEFAAHRVSYGYPDDVARAARDAADTVLAAVTGARAPFDGATARRWLERADPAWPPVTSSSDQG